MIVYLYLYIYFDSSVHKLFYISTFNDISNAMEHLMFFFASSHVALGRVVNKSTAIIEFL